MTNTMFLKGGAQTAIAFKEQAISYTALLQHASRYAELIAKPVKHIAILSENRPEWVFAFYGAWKSGAVVVPIDFMSKPDEIAYILNDCKPEIIFLSREQQKSFEAVKELLTYPVHPIVFEDITYHPEQYAAHELSIEDVSRTAVIIYTSGTTGAPKGVMLSFDNLLANLESVTEYIAIFTAARPVLVLLPLHHIFPLLGTMVAPLYVGAKMAFSPSLKSNDILGTLQQHKISIIIGVPRFYDAIRKGIMTKINAHGITRLLFKTARALNSRAFSKKLFSKVHKSLGGGVEYMVCGGAKLEEDLAWDFKTLGFEMLEGFGMTEAAPMITFTRPNRWLIGSAGEAMPGVTIKSVDGEIIAKGRNIMQGYFNRPEETAAILRDGWLHTGDLGYVDEKGFIHITGRLKDIIVLSNGKNINPEEIEQKLYSLSPYLLEAGVFEHADALHVVFYPDYAKLKEEGSVNLEEMFRWKVIDIYNKNASSYKRLTRFYISREELPKTRLGKIQRFKLAAIATNSAAQKQKGAEPEYQEYIVIRDYLMEQKKSEISPDDHLEVDLSLDSLDKVNLQVFLESTFGIKITEEVFTHHPTVEKLSAYMKEKKNRLQVEAVKWAEILKEKIDFKLPRSWFTHNLFKNISKYSFSMYFRIKAQGAEQLPTEPFILAPNHQSFFDGLFVSMFLKKKILKNTFFYAKQKHVKNRFLKALAERNNVIVIDINRDLKESLQKLAAVLKQKKNIIIFPEGTRSYTGAIGEFKKFFAILSLEFNVPVVPVSINGAHKALPCGSFFPRPFKKITVKFHPPVFPAGHNYESLTTAVQAELAEELAV